MRALFLLLSAASFAFGQVDPDTITVVAKSAPTDSGPDTVYISIDVAVPAATTLDDVLKTLAGVAVTERDLLGVTAASRVVCDPGGRNCVPAFTWSFRLSSSVAKMPEVLKTLGQAGSAVSYSVQVGGVAPTPECAYPTLISQARRHAESLAAAAGVRVGRVTALSEAQQESYVAAAAIIRVGDFSSSRFLLSSPMPYIPALPCAVAVQFQLLR